MSVSSEQAGVVLRAHGLRSTPQRRALLSVFDGERDEHLSADEIHSRAARALPDLSRGTVYATLNEFVEVGLLAAVGTPEPVRYETNVTAHPHFHCRLCQRLFDLDSGRWEAPPPRLRGYRVESVQTRLDGVCADCQAYQAGLKQGVRQIAREGPPVPISAMPDVAVARSEGPLGPIFLAASPRGLVRVAFTEHADVPQLEELARRGPRPAEACRHLEEASGSLTRYFQGSVSPDWVVDWETLELEGGVELAAVQGIPYGRTLSYHRLDTDLDPRAVGRIMGHNPIPIAVPCHRLIRGVETPEAYVGGTERRRWLGTHEGMAGS